MSRPGETNHIPGVEIGLCVRNGEQHLAEAVESWRSQSYRDFRLRIYDNASTDGTPGIADRFASIDSRIKVIRHPSDIGMAGNFIESLANADSPLFCWSSCDDLREPEFLAELVGRLDDDPSVVLACCGISEITRAGKPADTCDVLEKLNELSDRNPKSRMLAYLRHAPVTPVYGVFRMEILRDQLTVMRRMSGDPPQLPFRADSVVLALVLARGPIAWRDRPMLQFRRGGTSETDCCYGTAPDYLRKVMVFSRELARAAARAGGGMPERARLRMAAWMFVFRFLCRRHSLRITIDHLAGSMPWIRSAEGGFKIAGRKWLRRLRRRSAGLAKDTKVVLFGGGKHTRRNLRAIRHALRGRGHVVAVFDDEPDSASILGLPLITDESVMAELSPGLVIVSSDAYEAELHPRACACAPAGTTVWCLHDISIEREAGSVESQAVAASTS